MEKKKVKLLALQMGSVIGNKKKNIDNVKKLLEKYLKRYKTDFVFLPEVWTVGWDCPSFKDCAEEIETADSITILKSLA